MNPNLLFSPFIVRSEVVSMINGTVNAVRRSYEIKESDASVVVSTLGLNSAKLNEYGLFHVYEYGGKPKQTWAYDFEKIAMAKASALAIGKNSGEISQPTPATSMLPGDTRYWGGVKLNDVIVACSGFLSEYDQMISGIIAYQISCRAEILKNEWEKKYPEEDFV